MAVVQTFVPEPAKWEAGAINDIRATYASITSEEIERLLWLPYAMKRLQVSKHDKFSINVFQWHLRTAEKLAAVLKKYSWISEPYTERPDPVGETWNRAAAAKDDNQSEQSLRTKQPKTE